MQCIQSVNILPRYTRLTPDYIPYYAQVRGSKYGESLHEWAVLYCLQADRQVKIKDHASIS